MSGIEDVWSGIRDKLAERGIGIVLTPAFVFWSGGLLAWAYSHGGMNGFTALADWLVKRPVILQFLLIAAAILVISSSSVLIRPLIRPIIRILEGYWPGWLSPLRNALIARRDSRIQQYEQLWQDLAGALERSPENSRRYVALDARLRRVPSLEQRMPTSLGDILRAAEAWPWHKYGLDAVKCWPHMWLVLPESARSEITDARSRMDAGACVFLWGTVFVIWTPWAWWAAPTAIFVAASAYLWCVNAAKNFGDVVEASFDVYRRDLYLALQWPLPANPEDEKERGRTLTTYLWRGSHQPTPSFTPSPVPPE